MDAPQRVIPAQARTQGGRRGLPDGGNDAGKAENFQVLGSDQNETLANAASEFCRTTKAITFFDSMIVYERARRRVPHHTRR